MKFLIIIKPILVSLVAAGLWVVLHMNGLNAYIDGDQEAMAGGTIPFLAVSHCLFATFVVSTGLRRWEAIEDAVLLGDKAKFDLHSKRGMPDIVRGLMILLSLLLVVAFYLLSFENLLTGGFTIFGVILVLTIYWMIVADLDTPFKEGFWNVKNIPEEWRKKQ